MGCSFLLLFGLVSYGGLCYENGEESDLNKEACHFNKLMFYHLKTALCVN